ncbi:MAG: alpha/beta hydrolase [Flavobacteriaceae bacterium]|nr:alpha/beta hydrolase [Flavobacteriaceae bacterium]
MKILVPGILVFVFNIIVLTPGMGQIEEKPAYLHLLDIPYRSNDSIMANPYIRERCVLDLYYPKDADSFPTLVFFHGGGLTSGNKGLNLFFENKGIAIVDVSYRLSPKVKVKNILDDAAASIAWVFNQIESYGGDKSKIYISGHSAGGYITSMMGLDKSYLNAYQIDSDSLAGLIPLSGHVITHFTAREEMGLGQTDVLVDNMAPLYHIRKQAPPYIMITGDRNLEILARYEENAYMMRMMKLIGHPDTQLYELQGYDHSMVYPAAPLILKTIEQLEAKKYPEVKTENHQD